MPSTICCSFFTPGIALQWGAVGDVGYVGQMGNNVVICGKHPQRLQSVKSAFDYMLSQTTTDVIMSYVPADRSTALDTGEETVAERIARAAGKILGEIRASQSFYLVSYID